MVESPLISIADNTHWSACRNWKWTGRASCSVRALFAFIVGLGVVVDGGVEDPQPLSSFPAHQKVDGTPTRPTAPPLWCSSIAQNSSTFRLAARLGTPRSRIPSSASRSSPRGVQLFGLLRRAFLDVGVLEVFAVLVVLVLVALIDCLTLFGPTVLKGEARDIEGALALLGLPRLSRVSTKQRLGVLYPPIPVYSMFRLAM